MTTPASKYRERLDDRRADEERWRRNDARCAYARLAAFGTFVVLLAAAYHGDVSPWLLLLPAIAFGALIHVHSGVIERHTAALRAIAYYERGLARIEDRWAGSGETGDRFRDDHHLYANDLDLFGRGSLFELLSIAATPAGEETLAAWLKSPAAPGEILARQEAAAELTPALTLRELLARGAIDVRREVHSELLLKWAEGPPHLSPRWFRLVAWAFTTLVVAALVSALLTEDLTPLSAVLAAQTLFAWIRIRRVLSVLHQAGAVTRDLDTLARVLVLLQAETFTSPRLRGLQQRLTSNGGDAARAIRRLHRLAEMHDWQHNLVFLLLSMPFLFGTHLAWTIEAWRLRHGPLIRQWLAAVGEFEALASLSAYRYEHPDDPFPTIVAAPDQSGGVAVFQGESIGHPLVSPARMVRNGVRFDEATRLLVVSGSNMSGKSTLLRTAGINAVLAFAGAPVRATSLRLSPLALGATLRIQDSLLEGRSRFYAEITRIREIADLAAAGPVLFLFDELFHGTNSHDRLVGAAGVLRALIDRGSIGLVTTHDLALTSIADHLGPRAANVHFEDWFDGHEMRFDYQVKPGRVTRSNALALMRAVGLEVPSDG